MTGGNHFPVRCAWAMAPEASTWQLACKDRCDRDGVPGNVVRVVKRPQTSRLSRRSVDGPSREVLASESEPPMKLHRPAATAGSHDVKRHRCDRDGVPDIVVRVAKRPQTSRRSRRSIDGRRAAAPRVSTSAGLPRRRRRGRGAATRLPATTSERGLEFYYAEASPFARTTRWGRFRISPHGSGSCAQ